MVNCVGGGSVYEKAKKSCKVLCKIVEMKESFSEYF